MKLNHLQQWSPLGKKFVENKSHIRQTAFTISKKTLVDIYGDTEFCFITHILFNKYRNGIPLSVNIRNNIENHEVE